MKAIILSLTLLCAINISNAQTTTKKEKLASEQIPQQFSILKNKSNTYQGHKVIEIGKLDAFWQSVENSVKSTENKLIQDRKVAEDALAKAQENIKTQQAQLQNLKQKGALKDQAVQQSTFDMKNINVLGINFEKGNFIAISFGLIGILTVITAVAFYSYKSSKKATIEKQKSLEALQEEYTEFKKTAKDREVKLKRELQTEVNKSEELNQQLAAYERHSNRQAS